MIGGDWKDMFKGIQENDMALVSYYLEKGIDPNYQHPEFLALPLAESIRYNHMEIAKLLLENGADPLIVEEESGGTCLDLARKIDNSNILKLIEEFTSA